MHHSFSITRIFVFALLALSVSGAQSQEEILRKLDPFLSEHCLECHDDLTAEGDLDLTSLAMEPSNPINFDTWDSVFQRVKDGEMPPEDEPQPKTDAKSAFLKMLKAPLVAADQADLKKYGRVHGRRLTRVEYEHTLHDLLRIDIPLVNLLPADPSSHGFETVADVQQLSHFHLDKYLAAADTALDEAFERASKGDQKFKNYYGPKELGGDTSGNYRGPEARNGKVRMWPIRQQFAGRMRKTIVPESGWYRVTIKNLRALNPGKDGVVWGTLRSGTCYSNAPILHYIASVEAVKETRTQSFEAWIEEGHMLEFIPGEVTDKPAPSGAKGGKISYKGRDLEKDGFVGIEFDGIEMERIYPKGERWEIREKLFPGVKYEKGQAVIKDPHVEMRRLIISFAARAFRRPVTMEKVEPYVALASEKLDKSGGKLPQALRVAYRAILCSPRFLTFVESPGKLDNFALASRLSYMLWNSMPDHELRQTAKAGKLSDPKALTDQVNRMLQDPRSERFITSFTDQWLNLKEIDFTTPDPRRFQFDPIVQDSMVQETRAFVAELIRENYSVRNFLASDFSMMNTRLKAHYWMKDAPVKPGGGLQKVSLSGKGRSGLVTQGSILKVTADGNVTSPILRGIWINERILGKETPPPPPNVPAVEPDIRGATSIRDQLAKHSTDPSCAACHAKIDPAGFALENFDPTGQWRKAYGNKKDSAKVDPSGVTPEGVPFKGVTDWKRIHLEQPEMLARAFAKHLLTYGTGAPARFSDDGHLDDIVAAARKDNYGLRTIIQASVASPIFQNK